jgi:hypothetical protein
MVQTIIVAVIVLGALALTLYKIFVKPSCSCGCSKCRGGEGDETRLDPLAE